MEIGHPRLVSDLSSSDPAKRVAGLATVIQLANLGHDVSEYALTVLEKGFTSKQSTALTQRLAYHVLSLMHLSLPDCEALGGIMKKGIASDDPEVATAALRALAHVVDSRLLHLWPKVEAAVGSALTHRHFKVRQAAVGVLLAHIRSIPNRSSGVAMYHDTILKLLFESNAEVVDAAFHVLRELLAPAYPLYFHNEPAEVLYYPDAAEAFATEYVWFSKVLSRVPLRSRAHALRPITLLYLHMDRVSPKGIPQQSTAEDFVRNQLVPLLQFTGAGEVALEAAHCILLLCRHALRADGPEAAPEWVPQALWRVSGCLIALLNASLSPELKGVSPLLVLEAAALARLMADPDHIHALCAQLLHYVPVCTERVQAQLIHLCMARLLEAYELRARQLLHRGLPLDLATLVPLGKIGWWALALDGENNTYDALREMGTFVMLVHLYGRLTQRDAAPATADPTDALPLLAVAAQVASLCSECLEWGYKTTRQFVVLPAYLKLLVHLVATLQAWRTDRADDPVTPTVAEGYTAVHNAVQKTLMTVTQSTAVPMPTAVKGVLHCLLLNWAQTKQGDHVAEVFTPACEFLKTFMEKVPHSPLHEPTVSLLVSALLSFHARKGTEASAESLSQVSDAVPPSWAKATECLRGWRSSSRALPVGAVRPDDIHRLSSHVVGLAMDTLGNTNPDWSLVVGMVTSHPGLLTTGSMPPLTELGDATPGCLRHLLARHLRSPLFDPPPSHGAVGVLRRDSNPFPTNEMVDISFGYKLSAVCPVLWVFVRVKNNSEVALKNVKVTVGSAGAVTPFARSTTRPHHLHEEGTDSVQVTTFGFHDVISEVAPGHVALLHRCAVVLGADPHSAIDVRVDLPRATRSDLLATDTSHSSPAICLYATPMYLSVSHTLQAYPVPEHLLESTSLALLYNHTQEVAYSQRTVDLVFDHIVSRLGQQQCFAPLQSVSPEAAPQSFKCVFGASLRFAEQQEPLFLTAVGTVISLPDGVATSQGHPLSRPCSTFSLAADGPPDANPPFEEVVVCSFTLRATSHAALQSIAEHPEWASWLRAVYEME